MIGRMCSSRYAQGPPATVKTPRSTIWVTATGIIVPAIRMK